MKWILAFTLISLIFVINPVKGEAAQSSEQTTCAPAYTVVATATSGAGDINLCVTYPPTVASSTSTFNVALVITAPPTTLPTFNLAPTAFTLNSGCTEGTPTAFPPTTNGVVGTINTYLSTFTMTSEQCTFVASSNLVVGAAPVNIYFSAIAITVNSENARLDNFNYLCEAPALAPNAYSTTGTTCNDPNLVLSGELDVHQDEACGATIRCLTDANVTSIGNTTVHGDDFGRVVVNWFPIWMGIVMLAVAFRMPGAIEPNSLMTSSVFFVIGAIICPFGAWTDIVADLLRVMVLSVAIFLVLKWSDYRKPKELKEI